MRTAAVIWIALAASAAAQPCGDCDGNGAVTVTDALLAAQAGIGLTVLAQLQFDRCNVYGPLVPAPQAVVDVLDALALAQAAAGLPVALTCTPPLVVLTASLCDGWEASAYEHEVEASGGTGGGYSWRVAAGALPPALALSPSGTPRTQFVGTLGAPGNFAFTIEVTDSVGHVASRMLALDVLPVTGLTITTCNLPTAQAGAAYSAQLRAAGGTGVGETWSVVSGALPPGITLDPRGGCLQLGLFVQTGTMDASVAPALTEVSGIASSRRNPGVLWAHDDSGSSATLWAIDESGAVRQRYDLPTTAVDWEDLALGPGPDPALEYLYIGDVGDNGASRSDVRVLRVEEPLVPPTPTAPIALSFEQSYFSYPGGARDCETLLVDWESAIVYLLEKRVGGGSVYKFPSQLDPSWTAGNPVTLVRLMPLVSPPGQLTGGDASRDGQRVVVRNYSATLHELSRPAGASFDAIFDQLACPIPFNGFQQYEAICYSADGTAIFTTTEVSFGMDAPIFRGGAAAGARETTLSGIPTAPGLHAFEVELRDSAGSVARRQLSLDVR